uniref:Uncharacterized protein n=1 Tax=Knipowitschia caucasica TaxID=637954 RepID=A0AAV2MJS2_KNICA
MDCDPIAGLHQERPTTTPHQTQGSLRHTHNHPSTTPENQPARPTDSTHQSTPLTRNFGYTRAHPRHPSHTTRQLYKRHKRGNLRI